jgi:hypothetical protein
MTKYKKLEAYSGDYGREFFVVRGKKSFRRKEIKNITTVPNAACWILLLRDFGKQVSDIIGYRHSWHEDCFTIRQHEVMPGWMRSFSV